MSALQIVLSIIDILFAIAIIVLFLVQEGNDQGLGAVTGATTDSYYSKAKGRTLEEQLKRWTVICCVAFAVVSIVLYLAVARYW
ncbi:MAG: preprotein translocase subunit SecG [Saccharofermentans sp.]|jgi:preprotein translocase subunit SecG|nr:preprotein translocase subunit SecG [Mageeibacillus sp.]MCI1264778.1 preprotein translocase subunit SecG [Saccharofermentans sp.]MCI1275288.1 preprotein translocase subunit SecG [Saccharofermentans sp.]MCI1769688.1 preprotein translocase subunit SecG [Mageeibacillus sp.]MCI2044338.1 preprotein translocase subunit SecG [Mageeibacillus sp.]